MAMEDKKIAWFCFEITKIETYHNLKWAGFQASATLRPVSKNGELSFPVFNINSRIDWEVVSSDLFRLIERPSRSIIFPG